MVCGMETEVARRLTRYDLADADEDAPDPAIGERQGNLTVTEAREGRYLLRCDCGMTQWMTREDWEQGKCGETCAVCQGNAKPIDPSDYPALLEMRRQATAHRKRDQSEDPVSDISQFPKKGKPARSERAKPISRGTAQGADTKGTGESVAQNVGEKVTSGGRPAPRPPGENCRMIGKGDAAILQHYREKLDPDRRGGSNGGALSDVHGPYRCSVCAKDYPEVTGGERHIVLRGRDAGGGCATVIVCRSCAEVGWQAAYKGSRKRGDAADTSESRPTTVAPSPEPEPEPLPEPEPEKRPPVQRAYRLYAGDEGQAFLEVRDLGDGCRRIGVGYVERPPDGDIFFPIDVSLQDCRELVEWLGGVARPNA